MYLQARAESLHPLAEPQFERMNSINPPSCVSLKTPLVWDEEVYALGRDNTGDGKLFKYSLANNEWSNLFIPSSIYASNSVLTTYCSRLLLISGKNMTVWEFSSNDFAFKPSSIKPIPRTHLKHFYDDFITMNKDKYLIITYVRRNVSPIFLQSIYDGRDWNFKQFCPPDRIMSALTYQMAIGCHVAVTIASFQGCNGIVCVQKASMPTFDEDEGRPISWEVLEKISCIKCDRMEHPTILNNQQFFFVDSQGLIFAFFIQSPIVPVVWGNSGVKFQYAPYLVGLPNETMLMIGMVGDQHGGQLDIIKVSQKGNTLASNYNSACSLFWLVNIVTIIMATYVMHQN